MQKTLFQHDCEQCQYLGLDKTGKIDLYYCPKSHTPVARFSSEGSDYSSGRSFVGVIAELTEAYEKALKQGLVPMDKKIK